MDTTHIPTLKQMARYVIGHNIVELSCQNKTEAYAFLEQVLVKHSYTTLTKPDKSIVKAYLSQITGYSRAQLTRLLHQYVLSGHLALSPRTQPIFRGTYTRTDIVELARIDDLLDGLSGPATKRVLKREYELFGNEACIRLRNISVSHLYNLRATNQYRTKRLHYTKTKPAPVKIGERTKPRHDGRPGFLRVDSVH